MLTLYRVIILLDCLLVAVACYAVGLSAGGTIFLVLGVVFEVLFWLGLFGGKGIK
jgi:hypothetical protein